MIALNTSIGSLTSIALNTSFDFILNDFYFRAINYTKLNLKNIDNNVINLFNVNNYNNSIDYDIDNVKLSAMFYSYKFNNSLYNYFCNNNIKIESKVILE